MHLPTFFPPAQTHLTTPPMETITTCKTSFCSSNSSKSSSTSLRLSPSLAAQALVIRLPVLLALEAKAIQKVRHKAPQRLRISLLPSPTSSRSSSLVAVQAPLDLSETALKVAPHPMLELTAWQVNIGKVVPMQVARMLGHTASSN